MSERFENDVKLMIRQEERINIQHLYLLIRSAKASVNCEGLAAHSSGRQCVHSRGMLGCVVLLLHFSQHNQNSSKVKAVHFLLV